MLLAVWAHASFGMYNERADECWTVLMRLEMASHQVASMLHKRGSHACTACQGKLYVMGGWDSTDFLASVEVMDPRINAWQVNTCFAYASHHLHAV